MRSDLGDIAQQARGRRKTGEALMGFFSSGRFENHTEITPRITKQGLNLGAVYTL